MQPKNQPVNKNIANTINDDELIVKNNTLLINFIGNFIYQYITNYQLNIFHIRSISSILVIFPFNINRFLTDINFVIFATKYLELLAVKFVSLAKKYVFIGQRLDIHRVLLKSRNYHISFLSIIKWQGNFAIGINGASIDKFFLSLSHAVMLKLQYVTEVMKINTLDNSVNTIPTKGINYCLGEHQDDLDKSLESTNQIAQNHVPLDIEIATQNTGSYVQFLSNILSRVNDAIIATDKEHRVTYWNCQAEELYNIKVEEIIGQPLTRAFECLWLHPESQQACMSALTNNGSWKGENIHRRCNGEEIPVESSISVLKDEDTVVGFLSVVRDMRDMHRELQLRKHTEQILQEREERWNLVLQGSSDGIWDWNVQTNEVFFSSRWKEMRGFAEDEIGNSLDEWSQRVHGNELNWVMQSVADYFARKTPLFAVEYRTLCKDGTYKWIFSRGIALWDERGNVLRMAGSETDITARKLAEQQARQQAALIDITTDAILVLSLTGDIVFCNQGAQRVYGWEQGQMQGKNAHHLLYDHSSIPQLELALKTVLEQGEWHGELYQYRKDDRKIIVEGRWTVIRDEQGNAKSILTVATDITEKKQLEAQFLRTQRLQSIGTLASGIAHDLNNILTPILAVSQLLPLKLPDLDDNTQELVKIVLDNCKRGSDLIKQILSFARGTETLRTNLQAGHLLVEVARVARQTFPKSIEICMDIATKDLWTVSADATQLHQVLMNLCLNARDAMANGGTITLAIANFFIDENYARMHLDARVGPYVAMTISDTGCGITTENLERIFEPFFTTKELGKGTGLGLSTVLGIVKSHGGFVDVYSEPGSGTCFKIYLPAVEDQENPTFSELEPPPGAGELILIVDDETSILEITKTSLETYNYQALIARDGIEAIALFARHEHEIKAVLIDLMMPNLDSMTTIRTLQKLNSQVPIVVMSGLASNEVLSKAASTDIQGFLAKPFTAWELLNTLQKVKVDS